MNKKVFSIMSIALLMIGLIACGANNGRISGSGGAKYNANFYKTPYLRCGINEDIIMVSDIEDLSNWQKEAIKEHERRVKNLDLNNAAFEDELISNFNSFIFDITEKYAEDYFGSRKLIIVPMLSSRRLEWFEVKKINYLNSTLTIDLIVKRPKFGMIDDKAYYFGFIEVTDLPQILNFDLNIARHEPINKGRIKGVSGANFNARFYKPYLEHLGNKTNHVLLYDEEDLNKWHKKMLECYLKSLDNFVDLSPEIAESYIQPFKNFIYGITEKYDEEFFEGHQLVIIPMLKSRSAEWYEVKKINYKDGILIISLKFRRLNIGMFDDIAFSYGVIELTKFRPILDVELIIIR
ncbi:MAG: hypothetical protein FWE36_07035 [Erysipelotrichales bacterium]|nr:hypothetical protein [Erysipelotrichales bacterium]